MSFNKKIVFVTGGNTGLGLEIVKALAASTTAYEIVIGCRSITKGEDAITNVKEEVPGTASTFSTVQADLTSDSSLDAAVRSLEEKFGRLDILINNGGASLDSMIAQGKMTTREAFAASWDTNVTGTHILTTLAVPLLLKSTEPKILFITSGTSSISDTERFDVANVARINASPPKGWPKPATAPSYTCYRTSKTGFNMLVREWHRILLNDGVKVWAISPGFLATGLGGAGAEVLKKLGALDPSVGGRLVKAVVDGEHDHAVGKVVRVDGIQGW
ncbi:Short-chain dehydrogenase/reductase eupG [Paramyrothecium foliicola]|nr:Short-chain dehydrogenase/reductase eupG [Paramyrothecium foliicola]